MTAAGNEAPLASNVRVPATIALRHQNDVSIEPGNAVVFGGGVVLKENRRVARVGARGRQLDLRQPIASLPLIFLDIETTGIDPRRGAQITELAVLDWTRPIIVRGFDTSDELHHHMAELARLMAETIVVGHNLPFDLRHLSVAFERAGQDFPANILAIDTMTIAAQRASGGLTLTELATREGIDPTNMHTALRDAQVCRELLQRRASLSGLQLGVRQLSIHGRGPK